MVRKSWGRSERYNGPTRSQPPNASYQQVVVLSSTTLALFLLGRTGRPFRGMKVWDEGEVCRINSPPVRQPDGCCVGARWSHKARGFAVGQPRYGVADGKDLESRVFFFAFTRSHLRLARPLATLFSFAPLPSSKALPTAKAAPNGRASLKQITHLKGADQILRMGLTLFIHQTRIAATTTTKKRLFRMSAPIGKRAVHDCAFV